MVPKKDRFPAGPIKFVNIGERKNVNRYLRTTPCAMIEQSAENGPEKLIWPYRPLKADVEPDALERYQDIKALHFFAHRSRVSN